MDGDSRLFFPFTEGKWACVGSYAYMLSSPFGYEGSQFNVTGTEQEKSHSWSLSIRSPVGEVEVGTEEGARLHGAGVPMRARHVAPATVLA